MVDGDRKSVCEELEEQRCLIEAQQVEIRRQQHQIEIHCRRIDYVEAELAVITRTLQRATPNRPRMQRSPDNGTGHRDGNGNGHHGSVQLANDMMPSADAT